MKPELPLDYRWIGAHGLRGLTPWHFYDADSEAFDYWASRYLAKFGGEAWPFARREDRMTFVDGR